MTQLKIVIRFENSNFEYDQGALNDQEVKFTNFKDISGEDLLKMIHSYTKGEFEFIDVSDLGLSPTNPNHLIYEKIYSKFKEFDIDEFEKEVDEKVSAFITPLDITDKSNK